MKHHKKKVNDHRALDTFDHLFEQEKSSGMTEEISQRNTESCLTDTDIKLSGHQDKRERKRGAARMSGFMFWANLAAGILLVIGCYSPEWLTFKISQKLHYSTYSYKSDGNNIRDSNVFQDYGLWYISQCNDPGMDPVCKVMSYRVIDGAYNRQCQKYYDCEKIQIGAVERSEKSEFLIFSGAALVFSYSEFVRMQSLYTLGLVLSFSTLYYWYLFRKDVAEGKGITYSRKMWAFLFLLGVLSAVFILVPVVMFASIHVQIKNSYGADVKTPVGLAIAGSGGGLMTVVSVSVLMQLICCRREKDVYICSCLNETETEVPRKL